jgi:hypothetical protein
MVDKKEFELFRQLTTTGTYYQYVMYQLGETDKKKVKEMTYKVLFGRNIGSSKVDKQFKKLFPTIHQFIKTYKNPLKPYENLLKPYKNPIKNYKNLIKTYYNPY